MTVKPLLLIVLFIAIAIILTDAEDNNILLYNSIENCKPNEFFDVNYFVCKTCDVKLFLVRAIDGKLVKQVFQVEIQSDVGK